MIWLNMLLAVGAGFTALMLFTLLLVLTNRLIRETRKQVRYIRVWQTIRVVAGLAICGIVGAVVMQAFDLWLT